MRVRTFKAQICDDFMERWIESVGAVDYEGNEDLSLLSERISGEVVELSENKYPIGSTDYFELIDNNFPIPKELFTEQVKA